MQLRPRAPTRAVSSSSPPHLRGAQSVVPRDRPPHTAAPIGACRLTIANVVACPLRTSTFRDPIDSSEAGCARARVEARPPSPGGCKACWPPSLLSLKPQGSSTHPRGLGYGQEPAHRPTRDEVGTLPPQDRQGPLRALAPHVRSRQCVALLDLVPCIRGYESIEYIRCRTRCSTRKRPS